jgi:tetratricopeptide (TPR) repeat protein
MPIGVPDFHALHVEQGNDFFWRNDFHTALGEFNQALQIRESSMARYNRALALLSLGRYGEAWPDFAARYQLFDKLLGFTENGWQLTRSLPHWQGEPRGCVALLHEAGFGDGIMMLRFQQLMQTQVMLEMPEPLRRLSSQLAPIGGDAEAWCSLFDLPGRFDPIIPAPPYLEPDVELVAHWRAQIDDGSSPRVGIAWSSNTSHYGEHEFQTRSLPLEQFLELLPFEGNLFSLQHHDRDEAECFGVYAPELQDFADVAALASLMDIIVSIDTAALNLAGAIGHRNTYAMLSWAPTWRWCAGNRWYPKIKLCQTREPGDWPSAFAQLET